MTARITSYARKIATVRGLTEDQLLDAGITGYTEREKDVEYDIRANRSEYAALQNLITSANERINISAPKPAPKKGRYVELLEVAERDELNHGRSWLCTGYNVDAHGVSPEFEGQLICYVYN